MAEASIAVSALFSFCFLGISLKEGFSLIIEVNKLTLYNFLIFFSIRKMGYFGKILVM